MITIKVGKGSARASALLVLQAAKPYVAAAVFALAFALAFCFAPSPAHADDGNLVAGSVAKAQSDESFADDLAAADGAQTPLFTQANIASDTWGSCPWEITSDGTLTVHPGTGANVYSTSAVPWYAYRSSIKKVVFKAENGKKVIGPASCRYLLAEMSSMQSVDLSGFDASHVTDMSDMFSDSRALQSIDLSSLNTINLVNMNSMFYYCSSLRSANLSSLNTSNVTNMDSLFYGCSSLSELKWASANTVNVTNMEDMFHGCSALRSIDLSSFNTSNVTSMSGMFMRCASLTSLDLSSFRTEGVFSFKEMFSGCSSLVELDLSSFNTDSASDMSWLFYSCSSLKSLDLSTFGTSALSNWENMFDGCSKLDCVRLGYKIRRFANLPAYSINGHTDWYSTATGNWYSAAQISANRLGSEDTYLKDPSQKWPFKTAIAAATITGISDKVYTGVAAAQTPTVKHGSTTLVAGTDYTVSYSGDRVNVGTVSMVFTGQGNYKGSVTKTFKITPAPIAKASVAGISQRVYNGKAQTQLPTLKYGAKMLKSGSDYTLSYKNNVNAGTASMTITGKGNYTGSVIKTFKISPASITTTSATIGLSAVSYTYDGKAKSPTASVKVSGKTLKAGTDYTLTYKNNVNAGTATATVAGKGNYAGSVSKNYRINPASIASAAVTLSQTTYTYSGTARQPAATVKLGGKTLKAGSDYTLAYKNNVNSGTATATVTGKGNYTGSVSRAFSIAAPSVTYRTHVQNDGWQNYVRDGVVSGTSGRSLRLEGINISLEGADGSIRYRTHIQNIGWESGWQQNGQMSGTSGQALRLEAIQIQLTGAFASRYDVYYRVHCQNIGWMGWAKNGASAGSAGFAYRLEAIQIRLVPKGATAPGTTAGAFATRTGMLSGVPDSESYVLYRTHVQNVGWQPFMRDGEAAGTSGRSLRLEGININLGGAAGSGGIEYRTHVQNIGWQDWKRNGDMSGTYGRALRLEGIQIRLTGAVAQKFDVYYRVHAQNFGWMGWAKNGGQAGTAGYAYRLEAIQIKLVPKGGTAPGPVANAFRQR